jgi:hypothetical protein
MTDDPALAKQFRVRLILGKFRVLERTELEMKVALGGSTTMTVAVEPYMDVKAGDLLTLYTEVLYAKPQA